VSLAVLHAVAALLVGAQPSLAQMTPRQKAAMVVVSPLPAPTGVGGVIVQPGTRTLPRPPGAIVVTDQEGGPTRVFPDLPPVRAAAAYTRASQAYWAGRSTGLALRSAGVGVDLAPVLDSADGPLGSRQFSRPGIGLAFERGLLAVGAGSCIKHFPGLGSAAISTDNRPHVNAVLRPREVAGFRAAINAGAPCVMVNHAFYRVLGLRRASLEPATYRMLRSLGFRGLTITDSLSIVSPFPADWPATAARAGADLLLFTRTADAERAIELLLPLARSGALDAHVARVLRFRARYVLR